MSSWGIGHTSRFVIEQMFNGHFGAADPTASITENGEARRHRWNWMHQKRDDLGPPVFEEVSKMPPALMKAFGVGNFTRSAWSILSKGQKELRGWDFCKARVKIMIHWARKCPGQEARLDSSHQSCVDFIPSAACLWIPRKVELSVVNIESDIYIDCG